MPTIAPARNGDFLEHHRHVGRAADDEELRLRQADELAGDVAAEQLEELNGCWRWRMSESATTSCTGILGSQIFASGHDLVSSIVFTFSTSSLRAPDLVWVRQLLGTGSNPSGGACFALASPSTSCNRCGASAVIDRCVSSIRPVACAMCSM